MPLRARADLIYCSKTEATLSEKAKIPMEVPRRFSPMQQNRIWLKFSNLEHERLGSQAGFFSYMHDCYLSALDKYKIVWINSDQEFYEEVFLSYETCRNFLIKGRLHDKNDTSRGRVSYTFLKLFI